jgi:3-hydroxyisobutyrate dehydrogenase-like beta-hydroxyacid dehydrogenase
VDHACDDLVLAHGLAASTAAPVSMLATAQEIYRLASAGGHGARDISTISAGWRGGARA